MSIERNIARLDRILDGKEVMKSGYDENGKYHIADKEDAKKDCWNLAKWEREMKKLKKLEKEGGEEERGEFREKFGFDFDDDEPKTPSSRSRSSSCSLDWDTSATSVQSTPVKPKKENTATETAENVEGKPNLIFPRYLSPPEREDFEGVGEKGVYFGGLTVPTNSDLPRKVRRVRGWHR